MKSLLVLVITLAVSGCSPSEPTDTVASLIANPERLRDLRKQCKLDRAKLGDELCNMVADATRKRFMGDGTVPYTQQLAQ
ncbi:EexN family lipoprotein [Collimonas pratensis]|uniref:EexN family lipoprotein n=1 Tax=Collimonas pratensis TaxID=279113 RepID=UPI00143DB0C9|nr:EexN family lipoprotein [Collimonas pratensis]NKI70204.1 EexN family lipoprotein [Collimonas pratensis]